jgi:hypothetical protein
VGCNHRDHDGWLTGPVPPVRALAGAASAVLLAVVATACNRDARADGAQFCEALRTEQITLTGGVTSTAQAEVLVARYEELTELAPAAVRDEWTVVTDLLAAAVAVPADDAAAAQALTEQALAAQQDVDVVTEWVRVTCGVDLRPGLATDQPDPPAITPAPPPSEG